jgi:uncharacterized protein YciI
MPTFCIVYGPGPQWRAGQPTAAQDLMAHGRHLHGLLQCGALVLAGPFGDAGGMALLECADEAAALALARADPAVAAGVMTPSVHSWRPLFDRERGRSPFNPKAQEGSA